LPPSWPPCPSSQVHSLALRTSAPYAQRRETSASTISRIESGQHVTSFTTLERLAAALEVKLVVGFETEAGDRELVAV
jgi:transcriptional regulator with XRE-family HTH domain